MAESYDVVVIGGGAVGENAAGRAVAGGCSAALVESELFGGECSYWACMPSKALLRPGHALAAAKRVPGAGVTGGLDPKKVFERRDKFTSNWDDSGQEDWATGAGITTVRGNARLTGERTLTVDGERTITAEHAVVLATGSVPVTPPLPGLDGVPGELLWYSRDATSSHEVPGRLLVLGGGVVGVEMAQAWARLGSQVTMVVREERVLPRYESFAGDLVGDGLHADGVRLLTGTGIESVSADGGTVNARLSSGETVSADRLLLATGRRAATDGVGVEAAGLVPGEPLSVDDTGRVSGVDGGWLYAVGDVSGRAQLTHQGKYQARITADAIVARAGGRDLDTAPWGRHVATADHAAVPQVVFTDPEVAAVGLSLEQARAASNPCSVVDLDIAVAGSALQADGYKGKARMVVHSEREVLLGVTFVGQDVAEMLHSATIAVVGEVPLRRLWHAVPAYPTISEVWLRLMESYGL